MHGVGETPVTITNVDIPFGRLVMIILKVMLASIPAMIVFYAIFFAIAMVIVLILGAFGIATSGLGTP